MTTLRYITNKTAALIITPENRRYLTGFPSSLGYLLLTNGGNKLFVDGRYFEAAQKSAVDAEVVLMTNLVSQLNEELEKNGIGKLLIETKNEISVFQNLKTKLNVKVVPHQPLTDKLSLVRSVKKRTEIESIIEAQRISEKAFYDVLDFIKAGVTEKEIAAFLEYRMKLYGSQKAAFETIAVSGENSSMPHGVPTNKKVENGDFITMDFGSTINGYCSDMTRTVAVGFATDEMGQVYNTVLKAQQNVQNTIKAGLLCSDADKAARSVIETAGYGEYFCHSTGHGVGLEIHEAPTLSPKNNEVKLRAGQVVTNEPGIYLPKKFGVRIEDMLQVQKNGCKNLTKAPKDLIIL
ncbi:MAG: aminopeptidase P family protein [Clostridia bacterium]|nr:aminopeptidase P family protein [Clostridia bacterium]